MKSFEQDGNIYTFPDDCDVISDFDKQPFFTKLTSEPIDAKGCDIVAIYNGILYLIEAKDYSHSNPVKTRKKAGILASEVTKKGFDTLACLAIGTRYHDEKTSSFCAKALSCSTAFLCATIEPSRKANITNYDDRQYMIQLKELLSRQAKSIVNKVIVTRNQEKDHRDKFWESHWAPSHDSL